MHEPRLKKVFTAPEVAKWIHKHRELSQGPIEVIREKVMFTARMWFHSSCACAGSLAGSRVASFFPPPLLVVSICHVSKGRDAGCSVADPSKKHIICLCGRKPSWNKQVLCVQLENTSCSRCQNNSVLNFWDMWLMCLEPFGAAGLFILGKQHGCCPWRW